MPQKRPEKADTINKGYKYRIYPDEEQRAFIARTFGSCRFVYNHFLRIKIDAYEQRKEDGETKVPTRFAMSKMLTALKKETLDGDGHAWLYDTDATALVYELANLDNAYASFFRRVKLYKKGKLPASEVGFPKFKSRWSDRQSYKTAGSGIRVDYERGAVKLPKLGWVKAKLHREHEGRIVSGCVSRDSCGRYYVSLACDGVPAPVSDPLSPEVAVELGVSRRAVLSDGTEYASRGRIDDIERRLHRAEKTLSRRVGAKKGEEKSNRYLKQKRKVAKLKAKLAAARAYEMHAISSDIAETYGTVYLHDLDIKDMLSKKGEQREVPRFVERKMAKNLSEACLGELKRQIAYKSAWRGHKVVTVPAFEPTTQRCSSCGYIEGKLAGISGLKYREWTCPECGTHHDREVNSALNTLAAGRDIAKKEDV